jgi:hypothetical protein
MKTKRPIKVQPHLAGAMRDHAMLRVETDPHEPWLEWRVYPDPVHGDLRLQTNRLKTLRYWRDYPIGLDFQPTPRRCILWLSLFSNPYLEKRS